MAYHGQRPLRLARFHPPAEGGRFHRRAGGGDGGRAQSERDGRDRDQTRSFRPRKPHRHQGRRDDRGRRRAAVRRAHARRLDAFALASRSAPALSAAA